MDILSELDALNVILRALGRMPVNSTDPADLTPDALFSLEELRYVNRFVQNQGWHWNTERSVKLVKDVSNKVPVTDDVSRLDNAKRAGPRMGGVDPIIRKDGDGIRKLWDKNAQARDENPFDFSKVSEVRVDLVRLLDFEDTPDSFRHYVTIRAARNVQARLISDPALYRFTLDDEARALTILAKDELDTSDANAMNQRWMHRRSPLDRLESF